MENIIVVHKLNEVGEEVWRYEGTLLERTSHRLTLEARFDRGRVMFHGLTLRKGDRFIETFYTDRWYNTFAIYDAQDDRFKGWYCNISRPARIQSHHLYAEDLALDLIVYPDGRWLVLDEEEFDQLILSPGDREQAQKTLERLIANVQDKSGPFHALSVNEKDRS